MKALLKILIWTGIALAGAGALAVMVLVLLTEAIVEWIAILRGRKAVVLHESSYVATQWAEGD